MAKDYNIQHLIDLAKLAPKVEPLPENKKAGATDKITNIPSFFKMLAIAPGRNEVKILDLYNLYTLWDDTGASYPHFRKNLKKFVKFTKKSSMCKLNKKLITISEDLKEIRNDEEKDQSEEE